MWNTHNKRHRVAEWIEKQELKTGTIYLHALYKRFTSELRTYTGSVEGWKKIFYAKETKER